jgi:hypothetical protein
MSAVMTTKFINYVCMNHLGSGSCGRADFDGTALQVLIWKRFKAGASKIEIREIVLGMQACWIAAARQRPDDASLFLWYYGAFTGLLAPYGKIRSHPQLLNPGVSNKPDADMLIDVAEMFIKEGNSFGAGLCYEELGELARLAGSPDSAKHFASSIRNYEKAGADRVDHIRSRLLGENQEFGIQDWWDEETSQLAKTLGNEDVLSRVHAGAVQYERLYRFLHSA